MTRRKTMRSAGRYGGFTLIELLVVITIIALLIAILMPSLGKARTQARKTATLASLHDIGVAMATYESEYNCDHPTNLADANEDGRAFMGLELLAWMYNLSPKLFINPNTTDTVATATDTAGWPVFLDIGGAEITLDQTGYPPVIDAGSIQQVNWHMSFAYDHERKRNGNVNQPRVYVGDRADYKEGRYSSGNWGHEGQCLLWTDQHAAFCTVTWMTDQGDPCIYRHNEWAVDGSGEGQVFPNPGNVVVTQNTVDTHLRVFAESEDNVLLPNP